MRSRSTLAERASPPGLPASFLAELPAFSPQSLPVTLGPPETDEAHLWCFKLPRLEAIEADLRLLSSRERARFDAMRAPRPRQQFAVCRVALRRLLGTYLDASPESFEITCVAGEKPVLLAAAPLEFSYSHAEDRAAIVFVAGGTVGVDIEPPDATRDFDGIARRYFHPEEFAFYSNGAVESLQERFLRVWTAKEAILKASGEGLRGLERASLIRMEASELCLHAWRLDDGHVLSAAVPCNCNIHSFSSKQTGEWGNQSRTSS